MYYDLKLRIAIFTDTSQTLEITWRSVIHVLRWKLRVIEPCGGRFLRRSYDFYSLSIQICPKKGISRIDPIIPILGMGCFDPLSYEF